MPRAKKKTTSTTAPATTTRTALSRDRSSQSASIRWAIRKGLPLPGTPDGVTQGALLFDPGTDLGTDALAATTARVTSGAASLEEESADLEVAADRWLALADGGSDDGDDGDGDDRDEEDDHAEGPRLSGLGGLGLGSALAGVPQMVTPSPPPPPPSPTPTPTPVPTMTPPPTEGEVWYDPFAACGQMVENLYGHFAKTVAAASLTEEVLLLYNSPSVGDGLWSRGDIRRDLATIRTRSSEVRRVLEHLEALAARYEARGEDQAKAEEQARATRATRESRDQGQTTPTPSATKKKATRRKPYQKPATLVERRHPWQQGRPGPTAPTV